MNLRHDTRRSVPGIISLFVLLIPMTVCTQPREGLLKLRWADRFRYETLEGTKVRHLIGHVKIEQDSVTILCDETFYYESDEKAIFLGRVRMYDRKKILTADKVTYYAREKKSICEKKVKLELPRQQRMMFSDHLVYFDERDYAIADDKKKVVLVDLKNRARLYAEHIEHWGDREYDIATENPLFVRQDSLGTDSLMIWGDQMEFFYRQNRAVVTRNVKMQQGKSHAVCDTAHFLNDEEKAVLLGKPVVHQDVNRMEGKRIEMLFSRNRLHRVHVFEKAVATSVADSVRNQINRLTGKKIFMHITENQPDTIWVEKNATSFYYLYEETPEKEKVEQGVNVASGETITIYLEKGEVKRIQVNGNPDGAFYPPDYKGIMKVEK